MIAFGFVNSDGIVTGGGMKRSLPQGAIALPDGYSTLDLGRLIYAGGVWQMRPQLPQAYESAAGFHLDGLPDATVTITIRDIGTGTEDSFSAIAPELRHPLPQDCTVEISVSGPLPWLASSAVIIRGTGSPELAVVALARAKVAAIAQFNDYIGKIRLKYITDIPGQQTIYTQKQAEALAYLQAGPDPATLTDYPLLTAEIGVTAPTAWQLAQVWANKAVLWKQVAPFTERQRMEASAAIAAATNEAGVDAALQTALTTLFEGPL